MNKEELSLDGRPFIELYKLLKVLAWCSSGGEAKAFIDSGRVKVDGNIELRKRCKIKPGQVVEIDGYFATVTE